MHERNTRPEQQSGEPTHGEPSSGEPRSGKKVRSTEQSATAQEQPERARQRTSPSPRIYVASLSDYNAGQLHGKWIDADQEASNILGAVHAMLSASTEPYAEEWAIHDYEGFGDLRLGQSLGDNIVVTAHHHSRRTGGREESKPVEQLVAFQPRRAVLHDLWRRSLGC